jgi:hypothetical protein
MQHVRIDEGVEVVGVGRRRYVVSVFAYLQVCFPAVAETLVRKSTVLVVRLALVVGRSYIWSQLG